MQRIIIPIVFVITCFFMSLSMSAQIIIDYEKHNYKIEELRKARLDIEQLEKELLKEEIEVLQMRLKEGEISIHEFESEKKILAERHAQNIRSRTLIIDESIGYLKRNEGEEITHSINVLLGSKKEKEGAGEETDTITRFAKKQSSGMFLAVGFSNTLGEDHSLNDTPYKMGGSRFFEFGYNWRTAFKTNSSFHLRYGIGLQIDGYKPADNHYFVMQDKELHLEEHSLNLKKSKLRMTNLVVPLHLEFRKPKLSIRKNDKKVYSYYDTWNFGIGGYAGINLKTTQILKFKEDGSRQRSKENMSSGMNQALYGLSAYVGRGNFSLYARYALNDMFKNKVSNEKTLAIGLRYAY